MQDDLEPSRSGQCQAIGAWLEALGSAAPTPGGGGAAAVSAGLGAALVEMVCNLTIGKQLYAEHEEHVRAIREAARGLRSGALVQIDADAAAFDALMASYRLPKRDDEQRADRAATIQAATLRAAAVPLETAELGAEVVRLAAQLPGRSNRGVLSDVGVAAASAVAAIESAAINVEINLATLTDETAGAGLTARLARCQAAADQARQLVIDVRREIGR